jgi:MFS family permease
MLAFSDISVLVLQPLFYSTDIENGGLGLDTPTIGLWLGISGLINGSIQALFFAKLVARFGIKRVLISGILAFIPLYAMFPVINHFVRVFGMSWRIWALLMFQLLLKVVMNLSFGTSNLFVCMCYHLD